MRESVSGNGLSESDETLEETILYDNSDIIPYLENISNLLILAITGLIAVCCLLAFVHGFKK